MLRELLLIFVCGSSKQAPMAGESWKVPTPVKDLAALVEEPPSQFVQREEDRPGSLMLAADMPDPLPIVDLDKMSTADEATKLRSALQTWGLFLVRSIPSFFFSLSVPMCIANLAPSLPSYAFLSMCHAMQATNHGIDVSLMEDLMKASREFFNQPLQERQKYSNLREGTRFQLEGYGSDPVIAQDHILDWSDRLQLKVEPEDERNLAQWPKHPESFRSPPTVFFSFSLSRTGITEIFFSLDHLINQTVHCEIPALKTIPPHFLSFYFTSFQRKINEKMHM
jgi:hypothetical protein